MGSGHVFAGYDYSCVITNTESLDQNFRISFVGAACLAYKSWSMIPASSWPLSWTWWWSLYIYVHYIISSFLYSSSSSLVSSAPRGLRVTLILRCMKPFHVIPWYQVPVSIISYKTSNTSFLALKKSIRLNQILTLYRHRSSNFSTKWEIWGKFPYFPIWYAQFQHVATGLSVDVVGKS